jgi:hypothetical protein
MEPSGVPSSFLIFIGWDGQKPLKTSRPKSDLPFSKGWHT